MLTSPMIIASASPSIARDIHQAPLLDPSTTYICDKAPQRNCTLPTPWEAQLFARGSKFSRDVSRIRRRARSTCLGVAEHCFLYRVTPAPPLVSRHTFVLFRNTSAFDFAERSECCRPVYRGSGVSVLMWDQPQTDALPCFF